MKIRRRRSVSTPFLLVLGFCLGMVNIGSADDAAKNRRASGDLGILKLGMQAYYEEFGHLPTMDEGLWALMVPAKSADPGRKWPGFLRKMMLDPWGHEYFFERLEGAEFRLRSYGKDGIRSDDDITLLSSATK